MFEILTNPLKITLATQVNNAVNNAGIYLAWMGDRIDHHHCFPCKEHCAYCPQGLAKMMRPLPQIGHLPDKKRE
jgi:hypothetical protein